jgi:inhibitor of KinA sporulation pathway (predicted exonuclease)
MTTASQRHYLVVDFEATCDDNRSTIPRDESEIIEIGAVLCDGTTLAPIGEFQTFVRPVRHPRLTAFCTQLTTITQADVDAAPTLRDIAPAFARFAPGAIFCSWGGYDKNQLRRECERLAIDSPLGLRDHVNLKEEVARRSHDRKRGNREVLAQLGITPTGTYHRGIDDARNIALTLPFALGRTPVPARGVTA